MDRVSGEGNVCGVENRGAGDTNESDTSEFDDTDVFSSEKHSVNNGKNEQQKGNRKDGKLKKSRFSVCDSMFDDNGRMSTEARRLREVSPGHGFQVGDMVWGKVKSHPWWPGHVYSEEFATPSVRRTKREGLLLVAFFGDSSYGWFDPSELIPFDSNFAEKSRQTNSRTFVKAVEEALDEVGKRRGLGLSCMCRNKQNFRQTDVEGFFAVDVTDYDPGSVYSVDVIKKARDSFQPKLALDFVRQLALAPTSGEDDDIDFVKNKATVMSYRKAVYEEFDETYAQAFGHEAVHSSPGSGQELPAGRTPPKAPLSGRQVFADTLGKGKGVAKPNKPKDDATKDKYLFKRRDEPTDEKTHQKKKGKATSDPLANSAGDYMLQRRASAKEQIGTVDADASMETTPIVLKYDNASKVDFPSSSSAGEVPPVHDEKTVMPSSEAKVVNHGEGDSGQEKVMACKRPSGEVASGKSVQPEKKKKRKKESGTSESTQIRQKEGVPLVGKVSADKPGNYEVDLPQVLGDLCSLARHPFRSTNRRRRAKVRRVFLKFRSLVFQKSLALPSLADDESNETLSGKTGPENAIEAPQVKPLSRPSGGCKRDPPDHRQEDIAAKKKKVGDIRNSTSEKKPVKTSLEPRCGDGKQSSPPDPTMLIMRFPQGASLPSVNELKAKLGRYGPMDHSHTRTFWTTFSCRVVYKQKADAQEACKNVGGSSSLFGNAGIKCYLKPVGAESQPTVSAAARQPDAAAGIHLKSCLKKEAAAGGNSGGGRGVPRVKFVLGTDEGGNFDNTPAAGSGDDGVPSCFSSSSHSTMDINSSKNFQKPISTSLSPFTKPPPCCTHYGTDLAAVPLRPPPPPPSSMHHGTEIEPPRPPPPPRSNESAPNVDITQQMLSLLTRCNEIVTNVTGLLGYVPYHPL